MTSEPIPIPSRPPPPGERLAHAAGQWRRRARVQSGRLRDLLRAAQSPQGRQRNVLPLMMLSGMVGAVLGLALGWRSHRRR